MSAEQISPITTYFRVCDCVRVRFADTKSDPDTTLLLLAPWPESVWAFRRIWRQVAGLGRVHEGEPIVGWLNGLGVRASVFRYPLQVRHPEPLNALRTEIRRLRDRGVERIGLIGFSAGGHLAGLAALAPGDLSEAVDFAVLGYAITSMETESYRPARLILLGEDSTPELRRSTSLDALVTDSSPPFFMWHTAEDAYVPPEHTYRLARSLAASGVPHTVHVFAHGPHSLGLAQDGGDAAAWTTLAAAWIAEQNQVRSTLRT